MLIENMANKAAFSNGTIVDSWPFQDFDKVLYFGEELVQAAYSYYGSERFYSGLFGTEIQADIFIVLVYYQWLRHGQ